MDHTIPLVLLQPCTPAAAAAHLPLPVTPTSPLISHREQSLTGGLDRDDTGWLSPPVGDCSRRFGGSRSLKAKVRGSELLPADGN